MNKENVANNFVAFSAFYNKVQIYINFYSLIDFMGNVYQGQGLAKRSGAVGISKPYFEAIAVGISLALKENPDMKVEYKKSLEIDKNNRNAFYKLIEGRYQTHTASKIKNRIEFVKSEYKA